MVHSFIATSSQTASIWVIFDRSPDTRYRKKHSLPGVVIPRPNKPKNLDSFMFPSYHRIAALQNEGLFFFFFFLNPIYGHMEGRTLC